MDNKRGVIMSCLDVCKQGKPLVTWNLTLVSKINDTGNVPGEGMLNIECVTRTYKLFT